MDDGKRKAMLLGDLARLKSTWSKVEEGIASDHEAKERERQRAIEEARRVREAEIQRRAKRRVAVRNAANRLVQEIDGFTAWPSPLAVAKITHNSTGDTLIITEGEDGTFLINIDAHGSVSTSGNTSDIEEPLTEEAMLVRLLEVLIDRNRAFWQTKS